MKSLEELKKIKEKTLRNVSMRNSSEGSHRIAVGMGTCGIASGAKPVLSAFVEEVAKQNIENVIVTQVGCMGNCTKEPMVEVIDADGRKTVYGNMDKDKVLVVIERHIKNNQVVDEYKISSLD